MKKRFNGWGLWIVALSLFLDGVSYAKDNDSLLLDQSKKISPRIESVETCDESLVSWKNKEYTSGRFRLVRGHLNGSDQLYVQWIGYPHGVQDWATGKSVLVATVSIEELNGPEAQFEILSMKYSTEKSRVILKVKVQNDIPDPPEKDELVIFLGAPGIYSATWTSAETKFAKAL